MNTKLTFTTFTVAAIGLALATSAPAHAANSLFDQCHNDGSRHVLEKCCSSWIRQKGKPWWFGDTGNCHDAVACTKKSAVLGSLTAVKPKCKLVMAFTGGGGGGGGGNTPTPPAVVGVVVLAHP